jgi:dTDP-4-amino-4,6-dideoxygalactose transaminase
MHTTPLESSESRNAHGTSSKTYVSAQHLLTSYIDLRLFLNTPPQEVLRHNREMAIKCAIKPRTTPPLLCTGERTKHTRLMQNNKQLQQANAALDQSICVNVHAKCSHATMSSLCNSVHKFLTSRPTKRKASRGLCMT